jgi:hypothetical protein
MFARHGRHALTERTKSSLRCPCELLNATPPVSLDRLSDHGTTPSAFLFQFPLVKKRFYLIPAEASFLRQTSAFLANRIEEDRSSPAPTRRCDLADIGGGPPPCQQPFLKNRRAIAEFPTGRPLSLGGFTDFRDAKAALRSRPRPISDNFAFFMGSTMPGEKTGLPRPGFAGSSSCRNRPGAAPKDILPKRQSRIETDVKTRALAIG